MSALPPPPPPPTSGPAPSGAKDPRKGKASRGRFAGRRTGDASGPKGQAGKDGQRPARQPLPKWAVWVIAAFAVLLLIGPRLWPSTSADKLTYTEFLDLVREGKVDKVSINNSTNGISGKLSSGREFVTTGAPNLSDADEALLKSKGVDYNYSTPQPNWFTSLVPIFLPFLLIIGFFVFMQRRAMGQAGNIMSIGRSRAKTYNADKPSTTFADVAGYEGVKMEIKEVVDFLRMPEQFKEIGARVPKGILLVGPPGTGKTLFARGRRFL